MSVTLWGALVEPVYRLLKVSEVGESAARGPSPVPERLTVWGLPEALSETCRLPVRVPGAVGAKVTPIVQVDPGATLEPQLLVSPKFAVIAMLEMVKLVMPVLERVTV